MDLKLLETVQRMVVGWVATSPVGEGLRLVGGLRYRLLDRSCRTSLDIDFHWDGDLERKRDEILDLLQKRLLPEVRRRLEYDGSVAPLSGPDADSPTVKTLVVSLYRFDVPGSRIELPVDVTRIVCLDAPIVRTAAGTVYLTASDADMAESKVISLLQRVFTQDRDLLDLFLFQDALPRDAKARLRKKLSTLAISRRDIEKCLQRLRDNADVHVRGVDRILQEQVDGPAAANLRAAGGGKAICENVLALLNKLLLKAKR